MTQSRTIQPTMLEIARYVHREKRRLADKHHEFIDAIAIALRGWEPTQKQHQYLHSLFYKLGGRLT